MKFHASRDLAFQDGLFGMRSGIFLCLNCALVFSNLFHLRNHKTKKNSAPRVKFRLMENRLDSVTLACSQLEISKLVFAMKLAMSEIVTSLPVRKIVYMLL